MGSHMLKTKDIHQITLPTPFLVGPVHVYLIEGEALTLVDSGPNTKEAWELLNKALENRGYQPKDIEQVILTHHHPDHTGLAYRFTETAEIKGHWKNNFWLEGDADFFIQIISYFNNLYDCLGLPERLKDKILEEHKSYIRLTEKTALRTSLNHGDLIDGLNGWKAVETSGHAQTHISLLREEDGYFIGGDHILGHISSNAIIEAPYPGEKDRSRSLLQYREALNRCKRYPISKVLPGHGEIVEDVEELINKRLNSQDKRADQLLQLLNEYGAMNCFSLCRLFFKDTVEKQPALTMSEILGHLDLLEEKNLITAKLKNNQFFYYLNN
ncbi:MBL fold metallo-hydrolase [Alteribacillus sp. JSM 102045]|uniref:MBL fold metallo-hydrolase n=1 Tax=Alteribacillus sp. JSM 102045 TaxID=1562101 RepID=UPI0035C019F5